MKQNMGTLATFICITILHVIMLVRVKKRISLGKEKDSKQEGKILGRNASLIW